MHRAGQTYQQPEPILAGLVPENLQTRQSTKSPSEDDQGEQNPFWHAPLVQPGAKLVNPPDDEGGSGKDEVVSCHE